MLEVFDALFDEPLLPTSNEPINGYLMLGLLLLLFVTATNVLYAFRNAWQDSGIGKNNTRAGRSKRREVYCLLALGFVAFSVVNVLRFEHQRALLGPWRALAQCVKDWKIAARRQARKMNPFAEEMPNGLPGRAYKPDFDFTDLFPSEATIQKLKESAKGVEDEVLRYLRSRLPFFEQDWRHSSSVWDHFKMLVTSANRFWWLEQWFTGYIAWALFVGMESRNRDIPASAAISFVLLAYLLSLGCMQCLYFALLLLKPVHSRRHHVVWMLKPIIATTFVVVEVVQVASLPLLLGKVFDVTGYQLFNLSQGSLAVLPTVLLFFFNCFPQAFGQNLQHPKAAKCKQMLTYVWCIASILSVALHWYSTYRVAYYDLNNQGLQTWRHFTVDRRSKTVMHGDLPDWSKISHSIFGALGDHHYINALAFDVLFSAGALGCWSMVSRLDARSMLQCSMWPWTWTTDSSSKTNKARAGRQTPGSRAYEAEDIPSWANESGTVIRRRHATVPTRLNGSLRPSLDEHEDEEDHVPTPRRGRPPKGSTRSRSRSQARVASKSPGRARSQSRSSVSPVKQNASSSRRSISRPRNAKEERESEWEGYEGWESLKPTVESVAGEAEAAAVTWGLFVVGGLGAASSAVFGAEEVQR